MNLVAELKKRQQKERAKLLDKKAAKARQRAGIERDDQGHKAWNAQSYERSMYPRWGDDDE